MMIHLIIVSLLRAVITIGVVSTSKDVAVDGELAASEVTENLIEEIPVDEVIGQSEGSDSVDFTVGINSTILPQTISLYNSQGKWVKSLMRD
jgi:hypothetical protein